MEMRLLALLVVAPFVALQLWALVDVLRTPRGVWAETQQSQVVWSIVVLIPAAIGPILYFFIARPRLKTATLGTQQG